MVNWAELQPGLYPIRDYEALSRRWQEAFAYAFVRRCFNFTIPEITDYTTRLLGEDSRHRYDAWLADLTRIFGQLESAGVQNISDLTTQVDTREQFEAFTARTGLNPADMINVLKYLAYWFIPMKKPPSELFKNNPRLLAAINQLRQTGIRCNLDLLEHGATPAARLALAQATGAPPGDVTELVNRADFSRLPWASAATIANYIGAGYPSVARLAAANIEQVSADFYRWGESIGKNLKHGNEIESSHRIVLLVPKIIED